MKVRPELLDVCRPTVFAGSLYLQAWARLSMSRLAYRDGSGLVSRPQAWPGAGVALGSGVLLGAKFHRRWLALLGAGAALVRWRCPRRSCAVRCAAGSPASFARGGEGDSPWRLSG